MSWFIEINYLRLLSTGPKSAKKKGKLWCLMPELQFFMYNYECSIIQNFKFCPVCEGDHQLLRLPDHQQGADVTLWQGVCVHPSGIHVYAVSGVLGGVLALHSTWGAQHQSACYKCHGDSEAYAWSSAHCLVESTVLSLCAPQATGCAYAAWRWLIHNHTCVLWACELTCCRHLLPVHLLWYARHFTWPLTGGWTHHQNTLQQGWVFIQSLICQSECWCYFQLEGVNDGTVSILWEWVLAQYLLSEGVNAGQDSLL